MEKRIKILYCLTIAAILLFLGMQVYWLYGRYEYSLTEYENELAQKAEDAFDMYQQIRRTKESSSNKNLTRQYEHGVSQTMGDTIKTKRTVTVTTYYFKAQDLLGIPADSKLTPEQMEEVQQILLGDKYKKLQSDSREFDSSSAPSENNAWGAARNVQTEDIIPFTTTGIDSCLRNSGLVDAQSNLVVTDSMVWNKSIVHHDNLLNPTLTVRFPYSELECKSVEIVCHINSLDVLPGMIGTLVVAVVLSLFLILCLIWQFSTILKLSRLDKMRNNFITTMIHELKRPISTLKMCVSGIENEKMMADAEVKNEIITETRTALDNLSAYFSKLRDITFNNVEQIPLNLSSVNIRLAFDSVIQGTVIPSGKDVSFDNEIPEDLLIQADKSHLLNILNNLVENAIKYSGNEVNITANAEMDEDSIVIHIIDTGNGISNADKGKIFSRFYRGKASTSDLPGMGLGLAYVKLLVEAHGGSISVESIEGHGSTFTITLPR